MPHQCVRCGTLYDDGASEILGGCKCGARLFFYVKKEAIRKAEEINKKLTQPQKKQIEHDILDLVEEERLNEDKPVVLDFEAIRVLEPGKFELDLVHLFKNDPLIYKMGEGKYVIDLVATFEGLKKK